MGDLELAELHRGSRGVAGLAVTDERVVLVGDRLRAVLAVGDAVWVCGEGGRLARTRGASWDELATGTGGCLRALALGGDGAIWTCGDDGFCARVLGERAVRVELGTDVRLARVVSVRDEVVVLGGDGKLRRWADGKVTEIATGAARALTALCVTKSGGWIVTGEGGFIGRSPDGAWFSRVASGTGADLHGIAALADGRLIVVGDRGCVLVSADEGRTWKAEATGRGGALWCVTRFGGGVLIGGDDGAVLGLAPPGEARPLDAVLAIDESRADDDDEEEDEDGDDDDDDEEDDEEGEDDDDDSDDDAEGDDDVFSTRFRDVYGVPVPAGARRWLAGVDAGDENLLERMIVRGEAIEAFCGVVRIGTGEDGDTYHLEIHPWDEQRPRQVLRLDRDTQVLSVFADSLESFAAFRELAIAPTYEPERRDTEFFFYRSRWITTLLTNDRELAHVAELFNADFNQVVPVEQLPARYEACGKYIPTALYAMWRAYLFDEPELGRYLEIGRAHAARLVRDAAELIDELRGGRNQLGTIADVRGWLAAFRALRLDARTSDDQLLARIRDLDELSDAERAAEIPRLARALSPAVEAALVDAVVRGDDDDGEERAASGWDAIDDALRPLYGDVDPLHWAVRVPYAQGGNDPLQGISAYKRTDPVPHWHFVTYGFTDLYGKEMDDPEESGYGFELTFRLARAAADEQPPMWALSFLQNLARYVFRSGNRFAVGHKMGLNGPIALDAATEITAVCFAEDPELGEIASAHGRAVFLQVVGITEDEYRLIQDWSTHGLLEILAAQLPLLVTDLARRSVLADPEIAAVIEQRVAADGSAEDLSFAGDVAFSTDDGRVRLELGALYAAVLPRAMRGRIRLGRDYTLRGAATQLALVPASQVGYAVDEHGLTLQITQQLARELEAQLREAQAGTYDFEAWPTLEIVITPSFIRAQDGTVTGVRGIPDPARARRMIAEENARLAAEKENEEDAEPPPQPTRVAAALAMTARALRLAPGDSDVQFTHAMLLIDADRIEELAAALPRFAPPVRINVATRMGKAEHARFAPVAELVMAAGDYAGVAAELFAELGDALVAQAPDRLVSLAPLVPADVELLAELAYKAIEAKVGDAAMALYDRLLALPIPAEDGPRQNYLKALNNACVQAHAQKAFVAAAKIADRAQPYAHENPHIYHAAACAYAAAGDYGKALEQVRLAIEHEYEHVERVEVDDDLGPLLEWPEFKAMFRDWHARQEGN